MTTIGQPTTADGTPRTTVRSRAARIGHAARHAASAIRPLGWTAISGAIVGFVVGALAGWRELTALAVVCGAALVVAAVSAWGRSRYRVELSLGSRRVTAGQAATGSITVTNTSSHRLLTARIELPIGAAAATFALPMLKAAERHEDPFVVPTHRRAVIPVGPARSVRGDALGLIRRVVRLTEPQLLYVHPRTVPLDGVTPGFLKDLEGRATRETSNDDVSFHALRPYVAGDDRRYIHWKSSARTLTSAAATLMVRQFEETRRSHVAVTVSTRADDYADDDEFELAVSIAASLGVHTLRESRELSVVTSRTVLGGTAKVRLLDEFSAIGRGTDAGIVTAARTTVLRVPDLSVAFLICGSEPSPADIRAAALSFPVGVRVMALRAAPGAAAVRRIGSTTAATIGALDDFPRTLRRAVRQQ